MHNIPHSAETKLKISKALSGRERSPEASAKAAASNTGKKRTQAFKDYLSKLFKGHGVSKAAREKMRMAKLGTHRSAATKLKISKSLSIVCSDPMLKKQRSFVMLNGGLAKRHKTNLQRYGRADGRLADTWIELAAKTVLTRLRIKYYFQVGFCGTVVDFLIPDLKLVLETDGCFYHGCQECHPGIDLRMAGKEKAVAQRVNKKGYKILRVLEHDMQEFEEIFSAWLFENGYLADRPLK